MSARPWLPLLLILARAFSSQGGELSSRPPKALALVDQARALPPEFRADTLLRLANSSLISDKSWKQELIEEAYWSGSHAFLPYLQHANGRSDWVTANAVKANGLEVLTLQTKAVQEMLPLNPGKALRLFEEMQPVTLPKLNCSIASTPDVTTYYQTGVLLFEGAFTAKQRTNGDDFALIRQLINSAEAPAQVPPALEMVFAVKLALDQRRSLLSELAARLQEISRSDREYGAAETELVSAVASAPLGQAEAAVLLPALSSYIVRHVSARRCADNMPRAGGMANSAEEFNSLVAKLDPTESSYKHISAEEAKPTEDNATHEENLIGQSPNSQAVTEALRWLDHDESAPGSQVVHWTLKQRSSEVWLEHYDDAARLIHDLKETDEKSPEGFFCMKADALNRLAVFPPPGPIRDKAMEEYRDFLETFYPSIQNPNLWFTMFRHMLYTARFSDDAKDKAWILSELARSSNPIIAFYATLESRIGPPEASYPDSHVKAAHS
ncbi:MAG: hypothetical protein WB952_19440 [Terriglobales bacterium]